MFSSERKIIGVKVAYVEQALTEQYGRSAMHERGRSQDTVSYLIRITSKAPATATILPNPTGVTLRIAPYMGAAVGTLYAILIVFGLFLFVFPGLLIAFFMFFRLWLTGKIIGHHIDNVVKGAEHQARLVGASVSPVQPPPLPTDVSSGDQTAPSH